MNTKSTAPRKPKQKATLRSQSSSSNRRHYRPPTVYLEEPRFVLVPFYSLTLRAVMDGGSIWYLYQDLMRMPGYAGTSRLVHRGRRLVRCMIAKWHPFCSKVRQYTVLSESDFLRLLYSTDCIDKGAWPHLSKRQTTNYLTRPGGDFDPVEVDFGYMQINHQHDLWRQNRMDDSPMDDWNVPA